MNQVLQGDCLEVLRTLPENYFDSLLIDPPAGIAFMGKDWDKDKKGMLNWINWLSEILAEVNRTLKPGALGLVWSIPRTSHWTGMAIELAGFRIIDIVHVASGQGFPKAQDIQRMLEEMQGKEMYNEIDIVNGVIEKCLLKIASSVETNLQKEEGWENPLGTNKNTALQSVVGHLNDRPNTENLSNVNNVGSLLPKNLIETGINTPRNDFAQKNVLDWQKESLKFINAVVAELMSLDPRHKSKDVSIAQKNVDQKLERLQSHAINVEFLLPSQSQTRLTSKAFSVPINAPTMQCVRTMVKTKAEEALKIAHGNPKSLNKANINALCVEITNGLKHIILSQSKTFQNCDTIYQTECVSAMSVTITKFMVECLTTSTENIAEKRKNEAKQWDGWKTPALKPAIEGWWLIQKKCSESSIARNILKHGVGGLNIEAGRIEVTSDDAEYTIARAGYKDGRDHVSIPSPDESGYEVGQVYGKYKANPRQKMKYINKGRYPANLVLSCGANCQGENHSPDCPVTVIGDQSGVCSSGGNTHYANTGKFCFNQGENNLHSIERGKGTAARYFKQLPFDPETATSIYYQAKASKTDRSCGGVVANVHPTVKSRHLIAYFLKLITPPGGTVLDCFGGSGTTAVSAIENGFNYCLIEKEPEYIEIINQRIAATQLPLFQAV